jgi:predicted ATP-dependent serine protease
LNEVPKNIKQNNFTIPKELENLIISCLSKAKENRCNSVEEIISQLKLIDKSLSHETGLRTSDRIDFISKPIVEIFKTSETFVGRDAELKSLSKKIDGISYGKGFTVFIQGEPGIGKSQLVYQAANYALSLDMNVLLGRCLFNEGGCLIILL